MRQTTMTPTIQSATITDAVTKVRDLVVSRLKRAVSNSGRPPDDGAAFKPLVVGLRASGPAMLTEVDAEYRAAAAQLIAAKGCDVVLVAYDGFSTAVDTTQACPECLGDVFERVGCAACHGSGGIAVRRDAVIIVQLTRWAAKAPVIHTSPYAIVGRTVLVDTTVVTQIDSAADLGTFKFADTFAGPPAWCDLDEIARSE